MALEQVCTKYREGTKDGIINCGKEWRRLSEHVASALALGRREEVSWVKDREKCKVTESWRHLPCSRTKFRGSRGRELGGHMAVKAGRPPTPAQGRVWLLAPGPPGYSAMVGLSSTLPAVPCGSSMSSSHIFLAVCLPQGHAKGQAHR